MLNKFRLEFFLNCSVVMVFLCILSASHAYSDSLFDSDMDDGSSTKIRFVSTVLPTKVTAKVTDGDGSYEDKFDVDSMLRIGVEMNEGTTYNTFNLIYGGGLYYNRGDISSSALSSFIVNMKYGVNYIVSEESKIELYPFIGLGLGYIEGDDDNSEMGLYSETGIQCGYYHEYDSMTLGFYGGYLRSRQQVKYEADLEFDEMKVTYEQSVPYIGLSIGFVY